MIELETKGKVVVSFLIILGVIFFLSTRTSNVALPEGVFYSGGTLPGSVEGFYRAPPQDIEQLIDSNPSAVVVDCDPTGVNYIAGKRLPRAVWSPSAKIYYGQHMTMILYSSSDETSINYARSLVGKMYGSIYMLTGGYQAWEGWVNR